MKIGIHEFSHLLGNSAKTTASEYCEFWAVTVVLFLTFYPFPGALLTHGWLNIHSLFVKILIVLKHRFAMKIRLHR